MNGSVTNTSVSSPCLAVPALRDRVAVSVLFFSIFAVTFVLYVLIATAIIKNRKTDFKGQYYTYILSTAVCEVYTDSTVGIWGVVCNLLGECPGPAHLNQTIVSLVMVTWFVEVVNDMVIALDRLAAVCFFKAYSETDFERKKFIIVGLIWGIALVYNIPSYGLAIAPFIYMVNIFGMTYDYAGADVESPYAKYIMASFTGIPDYTLIILAISALVYAVTIGFLVYRRRKKAQAAQHRGGGVQPSNSASWGAQKTLMIQGFCHFTSVVIPQVLYNWIAITTFSTACTYSSFLTATTIYLSIAPISAMLILALNSSVRGRVKELLTRKKKAIVAPAGGALRGRAHLNKGRGSTLHTGLEPPPVPALPVVDI